MLELAKKQNKFTISKAEFFVQNLAEMIENEVVIIPKKEEFNFGIADCIGFQDEEKFYLNMTSTINGVLGMSFAKSSAVVTQLNFFI